MIIITKSNEQAIKQIAKAAASKSGIKAYENILIEAAGNSVRLTAGDGVTELSTSLDCEVKSDGALSVNATKLVASLNACKFECELSFTTDDIKIKSKKRKFTLAGLPADHYPKMPDDESAQSIEIDSMTMIESIRKANAIAPSNDVRHILNGVHVGSGVAASDGHRLVMIEGVKSNGFIIPKSSVASIPDIDSASVKVSDSQLVIDGIVTVKSKLIDGKFPDINRAVQDPSSSMTVDASEFVDAIKAATVTANKDTNSVKVCIGEKCVIESTGAKKDSATIEFDAKTSDHYEGGFNAKYLIDALSFYGGEIEVGFSDGNQMIIDHDGIKNVVMGISL